MPNSGTLSRLDWLCSWACPPNMLHALLWLGTERGQRQNMSRTDTQLELNPSGKDCLTSLYLLRHFVQSFPLCSSKCNQRINITYKGNLWFGFGFYAALGTEISWGYENPDSFLRITSWNIKTFFSYKDWNNFNIFLFFLIIKSI